MLFLNHYTWYIKNIIEIIEKDTNLCTKVHILSSDFSYPGKKKKNQ